MKATFTQDEEFNATTKEPKELKATFGNVQYIEVGDYNALSNKPKINDIEVKGNKKGEDYKLQDKMEILSVQEIEKILYL